MKSLALEVPASAAGLRVDAFLAEAGQRVTGSPEDLLVEVAELPVRLRVRAEGRGTGAEYTVAVRACLSEPRERE